MRTVHISPKKSKVCCIRFDGSTPAALRHQLVTEFQKKMLPRHSSGVLSIKARGVGLTLSAASTVLFAELSWTPGDVIQPGDCAHRIGQVTVEDKFGIAHAGFVGIDYVNKPYLQTNTIKIGEVYQYEEHAMIQLSYRSGGRFKVFVPISSEYFFQDNQEVGDVNENDFHNGAYDHADGPGLINEIDDEMEDFPNPADNINELGLIMFKYALMSF